MFRRFIIPLMIAAAGFGGMKFLSSFKKEQKRLPPRPFVRTVTTQHVQYSAIAPSIESMGRVLSLEEVQLTPEVSGLVLNRNFMLYKGRAFRKGDILLMIDTVQAYFSYSSTISDLQNALAGFLPELKTDLPQVLSGWQHFFSNLSVDRLPALPETKSDREKFLATRYQVYKLYFLARQQQNTLEKHTIRAPFTGTVETTQVYPSSMARAGVAVATVVRTDAIEVELALTEQQLPYIYNGMIVSVAIEGIDTELTGTINRISNVLDKRMQTASAFVRIEESAGTIIKSGAYAKVRIAGSEIGNAVAVPRKALHNKSYVYTIESDTLAEHRIVIVYQSVDTAYCTDGIAEGAELIIEPLQDAVIGMAVQNPQTARARQQQTQKAPSRGGKPGKSVMKTDKTAKKSAAPTAQHPPKARPAAGAQ